MPFVEMLAEISGEDMKQQLKIWFASVASIAALLLLLPLSAAAMSSSALITLTNQQRVAAGLQSLNVNSELTASATAKAQDMLARNYWAHFAPDGTSPWHFISGSGYSYTHAGENLAMDFATDDAVMTGWMNSPTHRANVLDPDYRDIGIAVVQGTLLGEQTTLVVAHYGTPTEQTTPAPVPQPSVKAIAPAATVAATSVTHTPEATGAAKATLSHTLTHKTSKVAQPASKLEVLKFGMFQISLLPLFKYQGI
jgi:hypothetical protein